MSDDETLAAVDAQVQAIADDYRAQDELCESMGRLLLGTSVATPGGTLAVIRLLRDTLEYLESRYARQIGDTKRPREAVVERAAKPRKAKRGRPRKANGTNEPAPAALPFGPGDGPAAEA